MLQNPSRRIRFRPGFLPFGHFSSMPVVKVLAAHSPQGAFPMRRKDYDSPRS